ncbi:VOC family protein [Pseudactinotalea suaedae]|uniref:VOC family protein n=1 Tax=Pseudactinotalea suaedae TaxID=1524924 RepID=UPI0012E117EF|nr:VOC family protein [Pseudactinotalea suaedae]
MLLHQVAQRATDLEAATAFYTRLLGTAPLASFDPPGLVFFALDGGTRLLLEANAPSALIYLRVPSVRERVEQLRADGVEIANEPHVIFDDTEGTFGEPATEWMAFIRDPEGNLVGLASREAPLPAAESPSTST